MLAAEIRTVCGKLKRRLREHGGRDDLTPSQVSVLLRLEKDGSATVSSLARTEGIRPQSMSAVVTPLQEAGLVSGSPDPSDGRQTLMSSGGQGREAGLAHHDHLAEAFRSRAGEASGSARTADTAC